MHFHHSPSHAWVCCLWTLSRSLPRLSFAFSCWGSKCLLFLSCSWACVSVSTFESPASFSEQRLPGFALPVPPSLFGGGGAGRGSWDVTGAPLSGDIAPCKPRRRCLCGMSCHHPRITWGSTSLSCKPPEEIFPSSSPFLCGQDRVASRPVAWQRRLQAAFGRLGCRRCGTLGGRRITVLGTFQPVVGSHLAAAFILFLPSGASARLSGGL